MIEGSAFSGLVAKERQRRTCSAHSTSQRTDPARWTEAVCLVLRSACTMGTGMRHLRIRHAGIDYHATLEDEKTARLWTAAPWNDGRATDRLVPMAKISLLPPTVPSKVVCVGRNYAAHARELGNEVPDRPLLFLKAPSAIVSHETNIVLTNESQQVEHEAEIALIIGSRLKDADLPEAEAAVFGFTCANDVTARDLQRSDVQFTRAKSFDTFCPLGPWIETSPEHSALEVQCLVNGDVRQHGRASDMTFGPIELVSYISKMMTLMPGDVVLTGTPEGVSRLQPGDSVEVRVHGIGSLINPVVAAP